MTPLTIYDSYEPFVTKLLTGTCQEDDVRDMFSPALPHYIAVTSSTSSQKPKFYCKCRHQRSVRHPFSRRQTFWTFSLHYRRTVKDQNCNGEIISTIPMGIQSSGHDLEVENDHLNIKLAGEWAASPIITAAILAVQDLVPIVEFTAIIDSRSGIPTLGYLVEVDGELHPEAARARTKLHNEFCRLNEEFDPQRLQTPTVRVLEPGTFGEYRQGRVEVIDSGSGQAKVPVLMSDNAAREWMLARVRRELGVDSNGGVVQG